MNEWKKVCSFRPYNNILLKGAIKWPSHYCHWYLRISLSFHLFVFTAFQPQEVVIVDCSYRKTNSEIAGGHSRITNHCNTIPTNIRRLSWHYHKTAQTFWPPLQWPAVFPCTQSFLRATTIRGYYAQSFWTASRFFKQTVWKRETISYTDECSYYWRCKRTREDVGKAIRQLPFSYIRWQQGH